MNHKAKLLITFLFLSTLLGCATQDSQRLFYGALNGAINGHSVRGVNSVADGAVRGLIHNANCYPVTALCNANLYRNIYIK